MEISHSSKNFPEQAKILASTLVLKWGFLFYWIISQKYSDDMNVPVWAWHPERVFKLNCGRLGIRPEQALIRSCGASPLHWHSCPVWNPTFLCSPLSHHEAVKPHWSSSCKHLYVFLPCMPREKVIVCVCVWVCISPSSLLSLSPHIQMSLHLSCKCLPGCDSTMHVCLHVFACGFFFMSITMCTWDQMWASLFAFPAVPEQVLREPALVSISGRSSKSGKGKTTRACQSWTNSLLTP